MKRTSCTAINFRLPFFHFNAQLTTSLLELRDNAFVEHIENSGFGHLWKHSSFVLIKQASLPTTVHYIFLFTETELHLSSVVYSSSTLQEPKVCASSEKNFQAHIFAH